MENEKAKAGRINTCIDYKAVNEEGLATIEAKIVVRDQSHESASQMLVEALNGLAAPAKSQVKVTHA